MGWFYGFKLHLIINEKGEIVEFQFTQVNVDDRAPLKEQGFTKKLLESCLEIGDIYLNSSLTWLHT